MIGFDLMSNAGSASVGASPKYLQIDLTTTTPPFRFKDVFLAEYPNMDPNRSFVSRTIVALDAGNMTLLDPDGDQVPMDFSAGEADAVQAIGVHASASVAQIKVFL